MADRPVPFSAVLLAGGRSRRMGHDKAMIPTSGGYPLWRRQWNLLEALKPRGIILSCRSGQEIPGADGLKRIDDPPGDAGPLAAVSAILGIIRTPLLLVLAVDLPQMTTDSLKRLLHACTDETGAVFVRDGVTEPLAAVYPVGMAGTGLNMVAAGRRDMQSWVREGLDAEALAPVSPTRADERALFNLNDPAALSEWLNEGG